MLYINKTTIKINKFKIFDQSIYDISNQKSKKHI